MKARRQIGSLRNMQFDRMHCKQTYVISSVLSGITRPSLAENCCSIS